MNAQEVAQFPPGTFVAKQLYCRCGEKLDGGGEEYCTRGPLGWQRGCWLECPGCGFFVEGSDAEVLLLAYENDII